MNYPIWERTLAGGGLLIAVIAVVHVYVAHFAVGGGFFLVITEWMGYRKKRPDVVAYIKTHTLFFLLLTMVFGAITGVGIWFTISLLSPGVTSILIHEFVFAWATEFADRCKQHRQNNDHDHDGTCSIWTLLYIAIDPYIHNKPRC